MLYYKKNYNNCMLYVVCMLENSRIVCKKNINTKYKSNSFTLKNKISYQTILSIG